MANISSRVTPLFKWVLPAVLLLGFGAAALTTSDWRFLVGAIAVVFLYGPYFRVADGVADLGDALVITRGLTHRRIPLAHIRAVELSIFQAPSIVILRLSEAEAEPRTVRFIPRSTGIFHPAGRGAAQDLMARIPRGLDSAV